MAYEEQLSLSVLPPFRLDLTVWVLRRRPKNFMDQWNEKEYSRVFMIKGRPVGVFVRQLQAEELSVTIRSDTRIPGLKQEITEQLKNVLNINGNLEAFYRIAQKDQYISPLVRKFKGVKPPRFPTLFESLINAIACQQVTLDVGITLLNRLSERYGKKFIGQYAFPLPEAISNCVEPDFQVLGFSHQKASAIIGIAKSIERRQFLMEGIEDLPDEEIINHLTTFRGIGRWSAEYVLLRGLGRISILPGDDVGAQKNLMYLLGLPKRPNYEEMKELTKLWNPYAGFIYFHLLLENLQKRNLL